MRTRLNMWQENIKAYHVDREIMHLHLNNSKYVKHER